MSLLDWVENAWTGNLTQAQLDAIKKETADGVRKASRGDPPAVVEERVRQATKEVEDFVRASDAHPGNAELRLPGIGKASNILPKLDSAVKVLWALAFAALVLWVLSRFVMRKGAA